MKSPDADLTGAGAARVRLSATGIRKSFGGVEVLRGVDLDIVGGSVVALLGENGAGKSTLVKIIAGDYQPDAGTITVDGSEHSSLNPVTARRLGVRMIFQEIADAPTLTVAENISLGSWPGRRGFVAWRSVRKRASEALERLGVGLDLDRPVGELSVGERQVVEIARAIVDRASYLILDEPTAALSSTESERLFGYVAALREQGTGVVYITHRLDEVRAVADRVVVLRDGNLVLEADAKTTERREMVSAMVGRELSEVRRPEAVLVPDEEKPLMRLRGGTSAGAFDGVDLDLRAGEVCALYGKVGSGAGEVVQALFGVRKLDAGTVEMDGEAVRLRGPAQAIDHGIGLLPADRQRESSFSMLSLAENLAAPSWPRLARHGFITRRAEAEAYWRWHGVLNVRSRDDATQELSTLSGGNQQKVLLGRWLERHARVLLLIEPTRGVDVGAREEIYRSIRGLAAEGVAVLVSTSDYEEVVQLADRAVVIARGEIVARLGAEEIETKRLIEEVGG
jgi:ribose transport system ATP-binding protein